MIPPSSPTSDRTLLSEEASMSQSTKEATLSPRRPPTARTSRSLSPHPARNHGIYKSGARRIRSLEDTTTQQQQQRTRKTPQRTKSAAETVRDTALQFMDLIGMDASELPALLLNMEEQHDEHDEQEVDGDNYDEYKVNQEEIQTIVNDRDEFMRLKAALKAKGAVTNGMLQQRIHVYVHNNRDRLLHQAPSQSPDASSSS
ncbi:expressed unknown protein [Seminavis robusta]|uniref:Uncharacterized protein n=1 Tax=Seminavis robusta TaxID=568900 RepID=A0A9N8D7L6_9STRA|nr:expressed unknown protein [Seminavis robusta]|eukprot:Sro21_g015040.1 n/a (201) ;mRNA; r:175843-176445